MHRKQKLLLIKWKFCFRWHSVILSMLRSNGGGAFDTRSDMFANTNKTFRALARVGWLLYWVMQKQKIYHCKNSLRKRGKKIKSISPGSHTTLGPGMLAHCTSLSKFDPFLDMECEHIQAWPPSPLHWGTIVLFFSMERIKITSKALWFDLREKGRTLAKTMEGAAENVFFFWRKGNVKEEHIIS